MSIQYNFSYSQTKITDILHLDTFMRADVTVGTPNQCNNVGNPLMTSSPTWSRHPGQAKVVDSKQL